MGRKSGHVALLLGAFLLVLAALAKFYAYDKLAVAPLDQDTSTYSKTASGQDATYLNVAAPGGPAIQTGPLRSTRNVVGQVSDGKSASKALDKDVAVWDTYSYTAPPGVSGDAPLSGTRDLVAFDRRTAMAVNWKGSTTQDSGVKKHIEFKGLYYKFPFHAQKKSYPFWDGSIKGDPPAKYVSTTKLKGLTVYKYEQVIKPTKIAELTVPGNLVGEAGTPSVKTDRVYANTTTLWVEPETGVIIKGQQQQLSTLQVDGVDKATITKATLGYDDKTISKTVDKYKPLATSLKAIRVWVPLLGLILGLVLLGLGALLLLRNPKDEGDVVRDDSDTVGAGHRRAE